MPTIKINLDWMDKNSLSFTDYARYLVSEGFSDDYRLEAYRGDVLCLFTNTISSAAKVVAEGSEFVPHMPQRHGKASLMRLNSMPATLVPEPLLNRCTRLLE